MPNLNTPPQNQIDLIIALSTKGKFQKALDATDLLINNYPDNPLLYNLRGGCYSGLKQLHAAINSYQQAIKIKPNFAKAHYNLGLSLVNIGHLDKAIASYKQAVTIKPSYALAHNNLGIALKKSGQLNLAINSFKQALIIKPDYAEAHSNLANAFARLNQRDLAIKEYERALQIKPDFAEAHNNLGVSFMAIGQFDAASKCYESALKIKPNYAEVHRHLSQLKQYRPGDPQIELVKSLLSDSTINNADRMHLSFTLAKVSDDLGNKSQFLNYLNKGNHLRKQNLKYTIEKDERLFDQIKKIFNEQLLPINNDELIKPSSVRPIFIIGMPRSGTTLTEQILASHNHVYGAGELSTLGTLIAPIIKNLTANDVNHITQDHLHDIRHQYLNFLLQLNVPEKIITDKMPLNFRFTGFILALFPEAKIIHLRRDARATCWSIYKHYFISNGNGFAYNLNDLAHFYNLYTDLMTFWQQLFPGKIYDLCYEQLTTNQEKETRNLLNHCDLNWEKQCLEFHTTKRAVSTASTRQVKQKMYQGSSEAWRKYEDHLQPLINTLN